MCVCFLLLCFRFAPNNKINYSQPGKCSPILSSHRPAHNYRKWQFKGPRPPDMAPFRGSAKGCMAAKCGINHKSNLLHHFSVLLPRPPSPNGALSANTGANHKQQGCAISKMRHRTAPQLSNTPTRTRRAWHSQSDVTTVIPRASTSRTILPWGLNNRHEGQSSEKWWVSLPLPAGS